MIGLGTFYNALGVVFGGLLGLLIGQRLSEDFHETLLKVTGVAVFVLGIAGTLEKMLVVHGSHVESHGSMMLILSLVIGTVIGELLKIEEGFERLGTWLKEKTGNQGDSSFVDAFMTTALTICIGAMAVVGAVQDGLTGDTSTLLAKAILDMVIVLVLTVSKGKGAIFAVVPLVIFQGVITLLAHLIAPIMTPQALSNLSLVGSSLILCVGINLIWGKRIKVANLLPAVLIAIIWPFLVKKIEVTGKDRLAFLIALVVLLEKRRCSEKEGVFFLQIWEFIYGKPVFWYDSRNFE